MVAIYILASLIQALFHKIWLTVLICILVTYWYPQMVAKAVPNTIVMPPMDHQCFISSSGVHVNYMNITLYDAWKEKILLDSFDDVFKFMPKFRYKIKEIAGDYYYEEMPLEEMKQKIFVRPQSDDKVLRSQADIDQYIADNMNEKLPMDGP